MTDLHITKKSFLTKSGILLQLVIDSHISQFTCRQRFFKMNGNKGESSLPALYVHWTLIFNLQQAKPIRPPAICLQQSLRERRVNALQRQVLAVPSPATRWMVLNLHLRKGTKQFPSSCLAKNYHVCSNEINAYFTKPPFIVETSKLDDALTKRYFSLLSIRY